jgi:hypothetical protein
MNQMGDVINILIEKPEGKRQFGIPKLREEQKNKMNLKDRCCGCGLDSSGSGYVPVVGSFERSDETSGPVKGCEVLDWASDYQLLKKDSGVRS